MFNVKYLMLLNASADDFNGEPQRGFQEIFFRIKSFLGVFPEHKSGIEPPHNIGKSSRMSIQEHACLDAVLKNPRYGSQVFPRTILYL